MNRLTHTFGIPMVLVSLPLFAASLVWHRTVWVALGLFVEGWTLQFIGHAFEGKPPEFFFRLAISAGGIKVVVCEGIRQATRGYSFQVTHEGLCDQSRWVG